MLIVILALNILALGYIKALWTIFFIFHLITMAISFLLFNDHIDLNIITVQTALITLGIHLLSINCATFFLYKLDKKAAQKGQWRIPEKTLHAFALVGGVPGALLARKIFRHKTKKMSFIKEFWGVVMLQLSIIIAIFFLVDYMRY